MATSQQTSLSHTQLVELQEFILTIAAETRRLIVTLCQGDSFSIELKSDDTPVTLVDTEAESLAREMIIRSYPEHGIIGEEFEARNPHSEFQWTIDPIDGTQNLINGIPTFGTLLGLRYRGEAILGVIDHPLLDLRLYGGVGIGVTVTERDKEARPVPTLSDLEGHQLSPRDLLVLNSPTVFGRGSWPSFETVAGFHPESRIYYDCYAHTLAALGSVTVVCEPNLRVWDLTPIEALMRELGGDFKLITGSNEELIRGGRATAIFGKPKGVSRLEEYLRKEG